VTAADRRAHAAFESRREAAETPPEPACCCEGVVSRHCGALMHPGAPCEDCGAHYGRPHEEHCHAVAEQRALDALETTQHTHGRS
jgi:hypothetical protein